MFCLRNAVWRPLFSSLILGILMASGPAIGQDDTSRLNTVQTTALVEFMARGEGDVLRKNLRELLATRSGVKAALSFKQRQLALKGSGTAPHLQFEKILSLAEMQNKPFEQVILEAQRGLDSAATYARLYGISPDKISLLTPDDFLVFSRDSYKRRALEAIGRKSLPVSQLQILPVSVEGGPVIRFPKSAYDASQFNGTIDQPFLNFESFHGGGKESVGPNSGFTGIPGRLFSGAAPASVFSPGGEASSNAGLKSQETLPNLCGAGTEQNCYLSAVSLHTDGEVSCSGVIVAPGWVLSAAHCACNGAPASASIGPVTPNKYGIAQFRGSQGEISVPVDTAAVTSERYFFGDAPGVGSKKNRFCLNRQDWLSMPVPAKTDILHAELSSPVSTQRARDWIAARHMTYAQHDLVLLKLRRPLKLFDSHQIAPIASDSALLGNPKFRIVGFGRNNLEIKGGHKTTLDVDLTTETCADSQFAKGLACVSGQELIMIDTQGKNDSCNGDSGAPVYSHLAGGDSVVVAIVSRGIDDSPCGAGGINTLVTTERVRNWIKAVTSDAILLTSNN